MLFKDIVGQGHLIKMLTNAIISDRVAHAYLFYGPSGTGKETVALAFAQALICPNNNEGSACGECISCKKVVGENHPDVHIIKPAGVSLKIEQVRALQKEVKLKPYEAKKKVFIINQAETLTGQAANSLLKTLEEPPGETVFILITVNPYSLLPTILSRCQQISFSKVSTDLVKGMLINKFQKKPEEATFLAVLADGIVGRAIQSVEQDNIMQQRDYAIQLAELAEQGNYLDFYRISEELENKKEEISLILDFMSSWYRDIVVWQETQDEGLLINLDKLEIIKKQNNYPTNKIIYIIGVIENIKNKITAKVNFRLAMEVLLLSLNHA